MHMACQAEYGAAAATAKLQLQHGILLYILQAGDQASFMIMIIKHRLFVPVCKAQIALEALLSS
jgi:hypothetical protein